MEIDRTLAEGTEDRTLEQVLIRRCFTKKIGRDAQTKDEALQRMEEMLKYKDENIRELIVKFRTRDEKIRKLQTELTEARQRITSLKCEQYPNQ